MTEIWEDVKNHSNYKISKNYPYEIRNKTTNRLLKFSTNNCGYQTVNLDGNSYCVHRIIAIQWLPNPLNLKEVNHKDHNRSNNSLDNLEWVSVNENRKDRKKYSKQKTEYLEIIPDTAIALGNYKGVQYSRYWFDYDSERLIMESYGRYHYINHIGQSSKRCILINDNGDQHSIGWNKFLAEMMRRK